MTVSGDAVPPLRVNRKSPGSLPVSDARASTAVMPTIGGAPAPTVPGEPISVESLAATKAPNCPTTLRLEITTLLSPAELSKVGRGVPLGDAGKEMAAFSAPPLSKTLTASPPVERPTPDPE